MYRPDPSSIGYFGRGYRSGGDDFAGGIAMMAGVIMIVVLALLIWAIVKCVDLVIRAWAASRGKSGPLKAALLVWGGLLALLILCAALTGGGALPLNIGEIIASVICVLLVFASIALLIVARITELQYRQTFLSEPETLVTKVLHKPWWTKGNDLAA